jgi:hypothetical protein
LVGADLVVILGTAIIGAYRFMKALIFQED